MERPCAMLGGMCVQTSECKQRPANSGLCPENTHLGVDCCYEVKPASNLTCHEYRGACMERCAEELQRPSTDCTDGSKCCVLVTPDPAKVQQTVKDSRGFTSGQRVGAE
uniref:Uncharacterized protein n=1 Tax=Anopheles melas TaxID=34690 RepID=A0A182TMN0_9DIPT